MSAAVLQDVNSVVVAPDHYHLVATELVTDEVAGLPDLAFVSDEYPSALEYPLHLELENRRIGVKAPVYVVGLLLGVLPIGDWSMLTTLSMNSAPCMDSCFPGISRALLII